MSDHGAALNTADLTSLLGIVSILGSELRVDEIPPHLADRLISRTSAHVTPMAGPEDLIVYLDHLSLELRRHLGER